MPPRPRPTTPLAGATENAEMESAELENVRPNSRGGKGRELENNAGPNSRGWKMHDWKTREHHVCG